VLLRFRGEAGFFVGEVGSMVGTASSVSKICVGSMLSPVRVRRVLVDLFGETSVLAVVWRRVDFRGLARLGAAGVNSSSRSSWTMLNSSSDSSSTTTFLRVARRVGRAGDGADMATVFATRLLECDRWCGRVV
jgi:hypothetical protein